MSDLADWTVLVTGATDGIGRAAAERLGARGATVLLTGRDERKGERAARKVREAHPDAAAEVFLADFADFDAVRELARTIRDRRDGLDALVNNAGTWQDERRLTDAGVEYTVAVNHFAPFLLTNLLVPLLRSSAPARVVVVASGLHRAGEFDPETFATQPSFDGRGAYADSKLANVLFAVELADRLDGSGVTVNAVHPGTIPETSLAREAGGLSRLLWKAMGLLPVTDGVADGARAIEYLATDPAVADVTGAYFSKRDQSRPAAAATDPELRERLWELSADVTGLSPEVPARDPLGE